MRKAIQEEKGVMFWNEEVAKRKDKVGIRPSPKDIVLGNGDLSAQNASAASLTHLPPHRDRKQGLGALHLQRYRLKYVSNTGEPTR